ncbi:MAG: Thioredoxin reductase [Labilithrix sp.]|nr:Thioredoxin reductase [Labilithrix sp.]
MTAPSPTDWTARRYQLFPTLTAAQLARFAKDGHCRDVPAGEILFEQGDVDTPMFVVMAGAIEIIHPSAAGDHLVVVHEAGQFTGEISSLSGGRSLVTGRMLRPGRVIEVKRADMMQLLQTDSDLSEVFLRAFLLRRGALIAKGYGDVVLVGSRHSAGTLRIQEFLSRNGHPYAYVDADVDRSVCGILDTFQVRTEDIPVVICLGEHVLKNPTIEELGKCLGLSAFVDESIVHDLVVVGAGPAGLAAAVYAASEGLDAIVLESHAPGGQAGSSSKIENYLGFPTGISGQDLAARALTQAEKFGAVVLIARSASRLRCDKRPYRVELSDGGALLARSIVIASGAEYHKPDLADLQRFEDSGVYYGATFVESQRCEKADVAIVGGGNSAGQAAVFLAQSAANVRICVRGPGLAESMSRYLIRRIEDAPNISIHPFTQVEALEGESSLEHIVWRNSKTGERTRLPTKHLFLMTGASPNTRWLDGCVALDEKGFVLTGPSLGAERLIAEKWPLARPPMLLETSLPGVFAVGDVRSASVKRVASAVGEGSICIQLVHLSLSE